jgi:hypothetical protein
MRSARPGLAALLAALAACGTGLYDAAGIPAVDGETLVCLPGQATCAGACPTESTEQCGDTCSNCFALVPSPPVNGAAACLSGTCGYECNPGYLKCAGGCCATTALAAGPAFTCALLDDGAIRCWGANGSGQLGDGSTLDRHAPVAVALPPATVASSLSAGTAHACAVMGGGAVSCWGANDQGQSTGAPSSGPVYPPAATPVTSGATAVVAGTAHTCALLISGAVTCWGSNALGQLGPGPGAPIASGASAFAAGANHTCAIVAGAVKCWGDNASGQLGNGTIAPRVGTVITPIAAGITLVATSAGQTCASTGVSNLVNNIDDVVRCWGDSLGATFGFAAPQTTPAIPMKDATHSTVRGDDPTLLVVGRRHACYQKGAESVSCFGAESARGQLGGAPVAPSELVHVPLVPVTVPAARALAAGADHACAALGDGRLRCWGANDRGQLGNGDTAIIPSDPGVGVMVVPSGR